METLEKKERKDVRQADESPAVEGQEHGGPPLFVQPGEGEAAEDVPRRRGRPAPALTPAQVESIRRRRRIKRPKASRPSLAALAAEFNVNPRTITKALRATPPYDFGEPVPPDQRKALHRDRGRNRRGLS